MGCVLATWPSTMAKPKTPLLTVDCVAFDRRGRLLLIRRKHAPFAGRFALPGGFVDVGETVEEACRRELAEEASVTARDLVLVGVYSDPSRDPRGHSVSVAFATVLSRARPRAGDDAASASWVRDWRDETLAFDHDRIVRDSYRLLRRKRLLSAVTA
jgi:8-oxo-dGTP diphosphatase